MINAGKYNRRITIYQVLDTVDAQGFKSPTKVVILQPHAAIKSFKGSTLFLNKSDFEKAPKNFTIRYSQAVVDAYYNSDVSNRNMFIEFRNKTYRVEYLNDIDEANVELEMQAKEVMK